LIVDKFLKRVFVEKTIYANSRVDQSLLVFILVVILPDRLCGLVVRVLGYRSGGPASIPGTTRFSGGKKKEVVVVGLERGPLSLVSTIEELLDRKVAAPV
jgi:hypothetical protein